MSSSPTADTAETPADDVLWHALTADEVAERLDVDADRGLSGDEAARRLDEHGPNRLAEPERRPAWRRFVDQFTNPLIGVLAGAAVLAGAVGDLRDAIVIGVVLLLNAILGYVQEGRAEDALAALEGMLSLHVTVRRDGRAVDVDADALVPGDVVLLEAGDQVPADGRVLVARAASVDEAMLTGESVPVDKRVEPVEGDDVAIGDRASELFMNTTLVRGRVELLVTATGMDTEVGDIAEMLSTTVDTTTPLERQLDELGKRLIWVVLVAVAFVLGIALLRGVPIGEALLEAVALGVAAIPEGLPAVVTVTLAVGVSRMAKRNAIVRRLASVETLGSTTVVCTDKTGTLTQNRMTPVSVWHAGEPVAVEDGRVEDPGPGLVEALELATHASDATLGGEGEEHVGDPTEVAVLLAARAAGVDTDALREQAPRGAELPFDSATKLMATVPAVGGKQVLVAVKGAPDVLLERCTHLATADGPEPLDDDGRARVDAALAEYAEHGRRVLAVASRRLDGAAPKEPDDVAEVVAGDLVLQALVAMVDPPRDGVAEAITLCARAGVTVKMITGDHPATAAAIAREIGIDGEVVTGRDLDAMDDDELAERIGAIGVCARVSPEHKVRIVDALRANDEVVAMTGDGVNDAAALRRAHVGVAMGIAGTEVTKQAADMVLADDDFTTIVTAVERGRTIYDNIVTFVRFQLTTNLAAITTILAAGVLGLTSPFTALQILFVNLIADGPPAMALGVDRPHQDVMQRPPRDTDRSILDGRVLGSLFPTALVMTAVTLWVLASSGDETATTMAFTTFVMLQLGNVLAVRGAREGVFSRHLFTNRWVWGAIGLVLAVQVTVVHVPFMQGLFETVALSGSQWALAGAAALLPMLVMEIQSRVLPQR